LGSFTKYLWHVSFILALLTKIWWLDLFSYMVALYKRVQKHIKKPSDRLYQISSMDNVFKHYLHLHNKYHCTHFMHSLYKVHKIQGRWSVSRQSNTVY
jgi:hypothetical protein